MIVTTTPSVEGKSIVQYHGVVVGEAILGANVFRDLFASITDIVGGRSGAYEQELGESPRNRTSRASGSRATDRWERCRRGSTSTTKLSTICSWFPRVGLRS